LLQPSVQRAALDRFAGIDLEPLRAARRAVVEIEAGLAELGGDPRERAREIDLLRFQVDEIVAAGLDDPNEDDELRRESDLLADATGHRDAALAALAALTDDGGAVDGLAAAVAALDGRHPFESEVARLREVLAELDDVGRDLRSRGEGIEADPDRLAVIGERRRLLSDLRRKYGDTVAEVMAWGDSATERLAQLEAHDERAAALDARLVEARAAVLVAEEEVARARTAAAPRLAAAVAAHLPELALPGARVEVSVAGPAGRDVVLQFAASPGVPLAPLARSASGGELARAMLALRLVLTEGPPVLVFDEVDAGIGGSAAIAVGGALADIGAEHQVLVVTHLAQVAAWADAQVVVDKTSTATTTTTTVTVVEGDDRTTELARMLSGTPDSDAARQHAAELLRDAHAARSGASSARVDGVRG
jgi:DNA repair protein RecN (Recombination protein N)